MKILHVAMGMPEFDRAVVDTGHKVCRLEWRSQPNLHEAILKSVKEFAPDIAFFQIQTPMVIERRTLEALAKDGIFTINWTGDVRDDIGWYIRSAPYFGVTCFTNQTDVDTLQGQNLRADYLQIGYDDSIYNYAKKDRMGVVFLGNDYIDRFPESSTRRRIVEHYRQRGLKAYGKGFGPRVTSAEVEVKIYQNASFALNIDHFNRPKFASDRVLRAQACGAIVCQMSDIHLDEHPFMWYGYPLQDQVPEIYHRLTAEYTRDNHTWRNRIPQIIAIAERWANAI